MKKAMIEYTTKAQRLKWVDALKGFGILCVVFGHLYPNIAIERYIYSFHMPLFFALSGFLYQPHGETYLSYCKRKSVSLIVPFLLWDVVSLAAAPVLKIPLQTAIKESLFLQGSEPWNAPIWFLVVLFFVEIIHEGLVRLNISDIVIIIGGIAVWPVLNRADDGFLMLNIVPIALVLYIIGCKCHYLNSKKNSKINILLIVAFGGLSLLFGGVINDRVSYTGAYFGNGMSFLIGAVAGAILYIELFQLIDKVLPENGILCRLGKQSQFIMCSQYWIFTVIDVVSIKCLNYSLWYTRGTVKALLLTAVTIGLCAVMIKIAKKIARHGRIAQVIKAFGIC